MSQFLNARENVVTDAIDGVIIASNGTLTRLDGYPHIRVVTRTDWDKSKVALVSGGGSGHEPTHAGFVGKGMLSAAVCGDVFASPSVEAVLAGILAVTGDAGCLLIVKNYTGDRLNFGLAAERARALGFKVNMVIIGDDIALPEIARPRGVAGTLFVHKVAGALSENGANLETITKAATAIISKVATIGLSLSTCTVPGSDKEARIPVGYAELGMGIHGEPGVEQIAYSNASQAVAAMVEKLEDRIDGTRHVALINNLGGTSELEMAVIANELKKSSIGSKITHFIGPASMMTAIDMHGFSISILAASDAELNLLGLETPVRAWPGLCEVKQPTIQPLPEGLAPEAAKPSQNAATRALIITCCEHLISAEKDLNALDAKSGDGDTGSTLAAAAHALVDGVDQLPLADHTQLLHAIGQELSQTMGGSSGVLLAIFFTAASDAASNGAELNNALKAGLARMQEIGGANLGDRTMVDALHPALEALAKGFGPAAEAARKGADITATYVKAKAGRATYVNAKQLEGHVDPGAEAVARLFAHLAAHIER